MSKVSDFCDKNEDLIGMLIILIVVVSVTALPILTINCPEISAKNYKKVGEWVKEEPLLQGRVDETLQDDGWVSGFEYIEIHHRLQDLRIERVKSTLKPKLRQEGPESWK